MSKNIPIIASTMIFEIIGYAKNVPAKIDTGADSSAIWASDIHVEEDGTLNFKLFDVGSPFYTGETISRKSYKVAIVKNSSGHEQIRYRTNLSVRIKDKRIGVLFNLSNRSNNKFPVLIGRRTIAGKFLVDVSQREYESSEDSRQRGLNIEMQKDPHAFYKKHYENLS